MLNIHHLQCLKLILGVSIAKLKGLFFVNIDPPHFEPLYFLLFGVILPVDNGIFQRLQRNETFHSVNRKCILLSSLSHNTFSVGRYKMYSLPFLACSMLPKSLSFGKYDLIP